MQTDQIWVLFWTQGNKEHSTFDKKKRAEGWQQERESLAARLRGLILLRVLLELHSLPTTGRGREHPSWEDLFENILLS